MRLPTIVLVSEPSEGQMPLYAIAVDAALPRLRVPLADADMVVLDLQTAYERTIASARVFHLLSDYTKSLVNPQHYTGTDQSRIRELVDGV